MDVTMMPLEVRMIIVFVVGVLLGSLVNWAVRSFAWDPRPAHTGMRPRLLQVGLGVALVALYWWEVARLGLIRGQLEGLVVAPPMLWLHLEFASHAILLCWMLAASVIDIDEKIIPDEITVSGTLLGLVLAAVVPMSLLPHVAERSVPAAGIPSTAIMLPGDGQATGFLGSPLWLEPLTPVSPNMWPPDWGRPRTLQSLLIALACYWLWCFALAPRIWRGRRGPAFALGLIGRRVIREFTRPPLLVLFAAGTVAIAGVWWFGESAWAGLMTALIGLVGSGGIVWAVRLIGTFSLRREAMGFGDVTFMMMVGTFLGWQACLIAFFLAPFAGLVVGILQFVFRRDDVIPYGPYLGMASAAVVVQWASIWMWAQPMFAIPQLVVGVLVVCLLMLGVILFIWRLIKTAVFGEAIEEEE
jgi:prepilin signal peptidase PulO-like enzyme (type II secretory pathway)